MGAQTSHEHGVHAPQQQGPSAAKGLGALGQQGRAADGDAHQDLSAPQAPTPILMTDAEKEERLTSASLNQGYDGTVCSGCRMGINDEPPALLDCLHAVCIPCFHSARASLKTPTRERWPCPVCALPSSIPEPHIPDFLTFRLATVMRANGSDHTRRRSFSCAIHDPSASPEDATHYCSDCGHFLCAECAIPHTTFLDFKDHQPPMLLEDVEPRMLKIEVKCTTHVAESVIAQCAKCRIVVCGMCMTGDAHRGHKMISVQDAAAAATRSIVTLVAPPARFGDFLASMASIESLFARAPAHFAEQRARVAAWGAEHDVQGEATESRTAQLDMEINEAQRSHEMALKRQLRDLHHRVVTFGHARAHASVSLQTLSPAEITRLSVFFVSNLKRLRQWASGPVKPCTPALASFGANVKDGLQHAVPGPWRQRLPSPNAGRCAVVVTTRGSVRDMTVVERYDPLEEKWTHLASVPAARNEHSLTVIGDVLYRFGGYDVVPTALPAVATLNLTEPVDVPLAWLACSTMSTARLSCVVVAVDSTIYVLGGRDFSTLVPSVERFETTTNTWTTMSPMPTALVGFSATAWHEYLYITGGQAQSPLPAQPSTIQRFDTTADTWELCTVVPGPGRSRHAAAVLVDRLYILGGVAETSQQNLLARVDRYDLTAGSWDCAADMSTGRDGVGVVVANDRIYTVGGRKTGHGRINGATVLSEYVCLSFDVECYDPETDVWTSCEPMPHTRRLMAVIPCD